MDKTKKFHLVQKETMTSPKRGRAWVKDLNVINKALLGKRLWRFGVKREALWRGLVMVNMAKWKGSGEQK